MGRLLVLLGFALSGAVQAQPTGGPGSGPPAAGLRVEVVGIEGAEGTVSVALYDRSGYLTAPLQGGALPIRGGRAVWTLPALPAGTYAIAAFHDANGNGELDRAAFGIPTETYGFSNGARGLFGPPDFEESHFTVAADTVAVQRITLR